MAEVEAIQRRRVAHLMGARDERHHHQTGTHSLVDSLASQLGEAPKWSHLSFEANGKVCPTLGAADLQANGCSRMGDIPWAENPTSSQTRVRRTNDNNAKLNGNRGTQSSSLSSLDMRLIRGPETDASYLVTDKTVPRHTNDARRLTRTKNKSERSVSLKRKLAHNFTSSASSILPFRSGPKFTWSQFQLLAFVCVGKTQLTARSHHRVETPRKVRPASGQTPSRARLPVEAQVRIRLTWRLLLLLFLLFLLLLLFLPLDLLGHHNLAQNTLAKPKLAWDACKFISTTDRCTTRELIAASELALGKQTEASIWTPNGLGLVVCKSRCSRDSQSQDQRSRPSSLSTNKSLQLSSDGHNWRRNHIVSSIVSPTHASSQWANSLRLFRAFTWFQFSASKSIDWQLLDSRLILNLNGTAAMEMIQRRNDDATATESSASHADQKLVVISGYIKSASEPANGQQFAKIELKSTAVELRNWRKIERLIECRRPFERTKILPKTRRLNTNPRRFHNSRFQALFALESSGGQLAFRQDDYHYYCNHKGLAKRNGRSRDPKASSCGHQDHQPLSASSPREGQNMNSDANYSQRVALIEFLDDLLWLEIQTRDKNDETLDGILVVVVASGSTGPAVAGKVPTPTATADVRMVGVRPDVGCVRLLLAERNERRDCDTKMMNRPCERYELSAKTAASSQRTNAEFGARSANTTIGTGQHAELSSGHRMTSICGGTSSGGLSVSRSPQLNERRDLREESEWRWLILKVVHYYLAALLKPVKVVMQLHADDRDAETEPTGHLMRLMVAICSRLASIGKLIIVAEAANCNHNFAPRNNHANLYPLHSNATLAFRLELQDLLNVESLSRNEPKVEGANVAKRLEGSATNQWPLDTKLGVNEARRPPNIQPLDDVLPRQVNGNDNGHYLPSPQNNGFDFSSEPSEHHLVPTPTAKTSDNRTFYAQLETQSAKDQHPPEYTGRLQFRASAPLDQNLANHINESDVYTETNPLGVATISRPAVWCSVAEIDPQDNRCRGRWDQKYCRSSWTLYEERFELICCCYSSQATSAAEWSHQEARAATTSDFFAVKGSISAVLDIKDELTHCANHKCKISPNFNHHPKERSKRRNEKRQIIELARQSEKSSNKSNTTSNRGQVIIINRLTSNELILSQEVVAIGTNTQHQPPLQPPLQPPTQQQQQTLNASTSDILMINKTIILGAVLGLIILVTFIGNVLVCLSVIKVRKLRNPANYLLVSLAISDLCVACSVMPFGLYVVLNDSWQLGTLLCNVYVLSDVTSCAASILNLCVISIDRYLAITRPLTYCVKRTGRFMIILIATVWFFALLISVPPLIISGNEYGTPEEPRCEVSQSLWYQLYATCISFYIPLMVMICLYYNIYTAAKRVTTSSAMKERKASITLGVIMSAFTICWLPFFILALLRPFSKTVNNLPRTIVLLTLWLGYANSLLNPIIYVTFHHDFRNAFKHLLCLRCMTINEHIRKDEYKAQFGDTHYQENLSISRSQREGQLLQYQQQQLLSKKLNQLPT